MVISALVNSFVLAYDGETRLKLGFIILAVGAIGIVWFLVTMARLQKQTDDAVKHVREHWEDLERRAAQNPELAPQAEQARKAYLDLLNWLSEVHQGGPTPTNQRRRRWNSRGPFDW
jgi:hypothetical protein